ncbi:chloride channel protein [Spongiibacter marinus]|uniref:chloride channel protein n=1 Tax=Spongiibacter marinus TaxID=354246 RepID=UPI001EF9A5B8|nr:chloride channel protein [Spongiibacter marinus]MBM7424893.1 H+/Cl- antiporter ClcA [Spongiibacter marinus]
MEYSIIARARRRLRLWWILNRRHTRRQLGTLEDWKMRAVFWLGALTVGLVIQGFAWLSEESFSLFEHAHSQYPYAFLVITPLGLMAIVWLMNRLAKASRGSGIPQVLLVHKQSYHWLRGPFLSLPVAILKVLLTCAALLLGATVGREGPSVHVGAALMYQFGHWAKLKQKQIESSLIVAGGAAGVSAAFNAPLAGIVFAIEELQQSMEARTTGTLIMAIILSGVVVLMFAGHYSYFGVPDVAAMPFEDYPFIIAASVVCGLLGGLFSFFLVEGSRAVAPLVRARPMRVAMVIGVVLALMGLVSGGATMGSGYVEAKALLAQQAEGSWWTAFGRILATMLTYFSGIPGGIFSPSLAAGAELGASMTSLFPNVQATALILVGMASYFAGVVQRPITAFVIVLELTGNNHDILPALMVSALAATVVSKLVMPQPVYHVLAQDLVRSWEHLLKSKQDDEVASNTSSTTDK